MHAARTVGARGRLGRRLVLVASFGLPIDSSPALEYVTSDHDKLLQEDDENPIFAKVLPLFERSPSQCSKRAYESHSSHWVDEIVLTPKETMKIRLAVALVGLAISFVLPIFAQQINPPDPQLRQKLVDVIAKHADAINKNAAAACFTQDAVYVTDRGPVNGPDAIEK